MISADGSMEKEVEARIGNATRMIGGMSEVVLRKNKLSKNTKLMPATIDHHCIMANWRTNKLDVSEM